MNIQQKLWSFNFVANSFSSFFQFTTFYILAVTLPTFITGHLTGNHQIGLATTIFAVATITSRPLAGRWLDEYNKKIVIIISLLATILCSFAYLVVKDFYALLALRLLHGLGFGVATTALGAIAADLVPEHRKGEGIGYFSLFGSLAMVIGPAVGLSAIYYYNQTIIFLIVLSLSIASFLCSTLVKIPKQVFRKEKNISQGWQRYIELKAVPISIAACVVAFSYSTIVTFLSVYAVEIRMETYASYFFIVLAMFIILSRPFTGPWYDRYGSHSLVYPGVMLFAVGLISLSMANNACWFLFSGAMIGMGFGAVIPSFQTIVFQASPSYRRGVANGTYWMLFDLGYGAGSFLLGMVAGQTNYQEMYFIAGIVVTISAVLYYLLHHRRSSKVHFNNI